MSIPLIHPSEATLIAFEANELASRRHERVARHLQSCVKCQRTFRFIRRASATAREVIVPAPPDALMARILNDRAAGERVLLPSTSGLAHARRSWKAVAAKMAAAAGIALVLILSARPEGLSAASGRLVHNIVHRVGVLRSLVDTKHVPADTSMGARSAAIPVFLMNAVDAASNEHFQSISQIKVFSDGRVLVNDVMGKTLRLYDSTLTSSTLVAGADSGTFRYGDQAAILIPYWGDSALFLDLASTAFVVLGANGSTLRTIALPPESDGMGILAGQPMLDPRGRLYYRVPVVPADASPNPRMRLYFPYVDSCAVVRADFETRTVDTVAFVASGGATRTQKTLSSGRPFMQPTINPVPVHDDWTVLADGTVAILRGRDYHVDWIRPDGSRASSAKLPFDWRKLDDAAKQRLLDSARTATEASFLRGRPTATKADLRDAFELVPMDKIPDYFPPLRVGSRRADLQGNFWIPPTTTLYPTKGGLLYDDVDEKGTISRRVLLQPGYSVAGFGPNGIVYMIVADSAGPRVARARIAHAPLPPK